MVKNCDNSHAHFVLFVHVCTREHCRISPSRFLAIINYEIFSNYEHIFTVKTQSETLGHHWKLLANYTHTNFLIQCESKKYLINFYTPIIRSYLR